MITIACMLIYLFDIVHTSMSERRPGEWWLVNTNSLHMILKTWWLQHATKHCFSNALIERMKSKTLFNTFDLTHWAAWGDLLSTWKHKYFLPIGGKCVVFGNSTDKRGKVVINGVKVGGVYVALTLIFCFRGVPQEWIPCVFEVFTVFWIADLSLCWSFLYIIDGVKLVMYDVWFAEDNIQVSWVLDLIFLIDYICKHDQFPCTWCQWVL